MLFCPTTRLHYQVSGLHVTFNSRRLKQISIGEASPPVLITLVLTMLFLCDHQLLVNRVNSAAHVPFYVLLSRYTNYWRLQALLHLSSLRWANWSIPFESSDAVPLQILAPFFWDALSKDTMQIHNSAAFQSSTFLGNYRWILTTSKEKLRHCQYKLSKLHQFPEHEDSAHAQRILSRIPMQFCFLS